MINFRTDQGMSHYDIHDKAQRCVRVDYFDGLIVKDNVTSTAKIYGSILICT